VTRQDDGVKLLSFGTSGRTGQLLVDKALAASHDVTASVRDRAQLAFAYYRSRIVEGQLPDAAAIATRCMTWAPSWLH
jgi:putative NADH-flavin reductase